MTRFEVVVGGSVVATYNTEEEAVVALDEIKHSFYALVHPVDCMYIRKKWKKELTKSIKYDMIISSREDSKTVVGY